MKKKGCWKRIISLGMVCFVLLTSIDFGTMTMFAAEENVQAAADLGEREFATGLKKIEWILREDHGDTQRAEEDKNLDTWQTYSAVYNSDWDKYGTYYYYNQLSPEWKEVWDRLDAMCLKYMLNEIDAWEYQDPWENIQNCFFMEAVEFPKGFTIEDGQTLVYMFLASNPQYYFLESQMLYGVDLTNTYMTDVSIGIYYDFRLGVLRTQATSAFQRAIEEALTSLETNGATEEEKLLMVHDYVVNNVEYDHAVIEGDGIITDEEEQTNYTQSAYSFFAKGKAVCTGYTEAMQILCGGLGLDVISVTSEDHAWNKVRIHDSWYNIDATWADGGRGASTIYTYYGISDFGYTMENDVSLLRSHTIEEFWKPYMPVCAQSISGGNSTVAGKFPVPEKTLDAPTIHVVLSEDGRYLVEIVGTVEGSEFYYTLDKKQPEVAYRKAFKYTEPFYVEDGYEITAIAVKDGYWDSAYANAEQEEPVEIIVGELKEQVYTGSVLTPMIEVTANGEKLVLGIDYTVSYSNNINAGTAKATVTMMGKYTGTFEKEFKILPKTADESFKVTLKEDKEYTYTGSAITPEVVVKAGETVLVKGKDYTVAYSNNVQIGTDAVITITYKGNYTGTSKMVFTISPVKVDDVVIGAIKDQTYTGAEIKPVLEVSMNGQKLVLGTDYTVSYSNNTNAGTAKAKVTMTGVYTGTKEVEFKILPKEADESFKVTLKENKEYTYTGSAITPEVVVTVGKTTLVNGKDYTISYKNNIEVGTANITIILKGNYKGTLSKNFVIKKAAPQQITSVAVTIDQTNACISKISVNTTVAKLIASFDQKDNVAVLDKNNKKLSDDTVLATGMLATLMNGNEKAKQYSVIVTGDISGDGKINITDMIGIKASILKKSSLVGIYAKAADVNGDGKVNITDFIKVKAAILKKDTITGVSAK